MVILTYLVKWPEVHFVLCASSSVVCTWLLVFVPAWKPINKAQRTKYKGQTIIDSYRYLSY